MNNFEFYLDHDHRERRRIMYISVAVGAIVGGIAELLKIPMNFAVLASFVAVGLVETGFAYFYRIPSAKPQRAIQSMPLRREFITGAVASAFLTFAAWLRIPQVEARSIESKIERASNNPTNSQNIRDVQQVLARAKAADIDVTSPAVLSDSGMKFIDASDQNPESWNAVLEFLSYKSALNRRSPVPQPTHFGINTFYYSWVPNDYSAPKIIVQGKVRIDAAAKFEPIGADTNAGRTYGNSLIFLTGGALTLDQMQLKDVVLRNSHVVYNGGQVEIENVYFVNCTFEMSPLPNSASLAKAILAGGAATTFSGM
jgi:hypothetical protein